MNYKEAIEQLINAFNNKMLAVGYRNLNETDREIADALELISIINKKIEQDCMRCEVTHYDVEIYEYCAKCRENMNRINM